MRLRHDCPSLSVAVQSCCRSVHRPLRFSAMNDFVARFGLQTASRSASWSRSAAPLLSRSHRATGGVSLTARRVAPSAQAQAYPLPVLERPRLRCVDPRARRRPTTPTARRIAPTRRWPTTASRRRATAMRRRPRPRRTGSRQAHHRRERLARTASLRTTSTVGQRRAVTEAERCAVERNPGAFSKQVQEKAAATKLKIEHYYKKAVEEVVERSQRCVYAARSSG